MKPGAYGEVKRMGAAHSIRTSQLPGDGCSGEAERMEW